jgi:hypothetical protein
MRAFIYSLLTDPGSAQATELHDLVKPQRIRSSGNANVNTTVSLPVPFIVLRELMSTHQFGSVRFSPVQIHVHDQPNSYARIDTIQALIIELMNSVEPQWFSDKWIMHLGDQGWSEDLYDDHYGTATRYGTYGIMARH